MNKDSKRKDALLYHSLPKPGKISVVPTKPTSSQRDLSLAYSPGVAEPCLEIAQNPNEVYKYTAKGNLVAVISNGTAVLGLGDIGAEASKPVMEGKGLLFKIFSDIDVFDIEIDTKDTEEFINTVKRIAPTFGGINLEDIKAPESFEIEQRLKDELNIPVMHDDQHGTAIISAAGLLNALELAGKNIEDIKMVVSGAGSAALACTNLYLQLGLKIENVLMFDSKGVISTKRDNIRPYQQKFAREVENISLAEAVKGADVFIGLSTADILTPEMLLTMNHNPIVFAMANPNPEIAYDLAVSTRKDIIMATGRSDNPNQVNNVLGFPFIFRGALDVRATKINEEMKMAAVHALAKLAKEPVPEQVNIAYGKTHLEFGREYILPKPLDPRLIVEVSSAVAKAAMESGVATEPITDWNKYRDQLAARLGNDNKLLRMLINRAKTAPKKVVYTEADQIDMLKAAHIAHEEGFATPVLLGNVEEIKKLKEEVGFYADVEIIDPKSAEQDERREKFAQDFWHKRQRRGATLLGARRKMKDRVYFASMLVNSGYADAIITGYTRSYPSSLKPLLESIPREEGVKKVATTNLMFTSKGPLFVADTAVNPNPTAEELVNIAVKISDVVKMFGLEPSIALTSFSNFGSSNDESAQKMRTVASILHKEYPKLIVDGEIQVDFALNQEMLKEKFPFSKLAGNKVNTLLFPNLDAANSTYKLLKELNNATSVGPILLGFSKSVHVAQLKASVEEIVNLTAIAVVGAQQK